MSQRRNFAADASAMLGGGAAEERNPFTLPSDEEVRYVAQSCRA